MRFKFHIVNEDGEIIVGGSTFISKINEYGECESVDEEVGRALRYIRKSEFDPSDTEEKSDYVDEEEIPLFKGTKEALDKLTIRPCIKHDYKTVVNPYKDGEISTDSFVGVEWVEEKVCEKCGATLTPQNNQNN